MVTNTYWSQHAVPGVMAVAAKRFESCMPERRLRKGSPPGFPALVQQFFSEYLVAQRVLSPRTAASHRDAMTLFLAQATDDLGKTPMTLQLTDITPELVLGFLAHLERERDKSVRSRSLRLTALRAFLKFAGRRDVSALHAVVEPIAPRVSPFLRRAPEAPGRSARTPG